MTGNLISRSEIERSKQSEEIIRETAVQVIKDFATFGMDVEFPADLQYAYDNLFEQLKVIVAGLLQTNPEKLSALMYQIDLDEKKVRESEIPLFNEHEWISDLILEREFLKVLTRHYFKNHR